MGGVGEKIKFGKEVDAYKFYLCNFRIQRVYLVYFYLFSFSRAWSGHGNNFAYDINLL